PYYYININNNFSIIDQIISKGFKYIYLVNQFKQKILQNTIFNNCLTSIIKDIEQKSKNIESDLVKTGIYRLELNKKFSHEYIETLTNIFTGYGFKNIKISENEITFEL